MSFKIISVGEVLWDLLPSGPEMGGAPANFACHARALGAQVGVVTRVGLDYLGRDIRQRFEKTGFPLDLVQVDERAPTGTVSVELEGDGIPRFTICEQVAWDHLQLSEVALKSAAGADAICFGSLAQRGEPSRSTILRLVGQTPASALRIFDANLRQQFYSREVVQKSLYLANVLKLNDAELPVVAKMFGLSGNMEMQVESLAKQFELRVVALTCGAQGSLLYQSGRWSECRARTVRVKDTVGAGDAFTAALAIGLLCKMDLDDINIAANEVARHVCSCAGATPPLPHELHGLFVNCYPGRGPATGELAGAQV